MSESLLQTRRTTDVPLASDAQENYILLLVLLCLFAVGTLMVLFILLIFCHRCCGQQRRHSRASEDQEKTNTTYIEENQPAHEVSIRLDGTESISSRHGETESDHFLSLAGAGRRVSFNETAIYEQSAKDKERERRYTLTEGDFHHLKKSRLTHTHMQPPALKINTIMECDTTENNTNTSDMTTHTHLLALFQPVESVSSDSCVLWMNQSCSSALPGDSLNTSEQTSKPPRSQTLDMLNRSTMTEEDSVLTGPVAGGPAQTHGSVFQFLSKLRRHASLEGAGPFYSVKKWSFDSIQRAASLDTRGSPRRCAFQRQRAASETLDFKEEHLQTRVCDFLLRNDPSYPQSDPPRRLSAGSLEQSTGPELSRLEMERMTEVRCSTEIDPSSPLQMKSLEENGHMCEEFRSESRQESFEQPSLYRDIWSLRASLEQYASSDLSSNDRDSTRSDADSVCSIGPSRAGVSCFHSQDIDDEMDEDVELSYDECPRRNERDSVDAETSNRKLLQMDSGYASIEAPCKPLEEFRLFGSSSGKTASERRRFFTSAGRKGTVCESFDARLFKEELEDEASERAASLETGNPEPAAKPRAAFRRRDYSIDEKTEALFNEFLRHDPQFDQQGSVLPTLRHRHRSRVHLRKQWQRSKQYSDPGANRYSPSLERHRFYPLRRGNSANYPLDTRYHSTLPRIASAADEEASEGAATTECHKVELENECSAPDLEENSNNSSNNASRLRDTSAGVCEILDRHTDTRKYSESSSHTDSDPDSCMHHILIDTNPSDKLVMSALDHRLNSGLRHTNQEFTVSTSRTSPDVEEE